MLCQHSVQPSSCTEVHLTVQYAHCLAMQEQYEWNPGGEQRAHCTCHVGSAEAEQGDEAVAEGSVTAPLLLGQAVHLAPEPRVQLDAARRA
jgi:hypothetical protein